MQKKVVLTISILISNRPDTVRKCLESVKPILNNVDAELILTDTGCGSQVRGIIEEYTDNIIEFEWCRDFSKARNAGLKKAKGEWFLFLDDDEWFDDVTEIIDFFNSGEYRKYGLATYYQRNYGDKEGTVYNDLLVGRMIRLEPDICFEYAIHECFNRVPGDTKMLNVFVHHYGYVYQSKQQKMAHSRRNVTLLLEEHRNNPGNLKHVIQLAQEYNALQDWNQSMLISQEGILYDRKGQVTQTFCRNSLYVNVIDCYMEMLDYGQVIAVGNQYLKEEKLDELAEAVIRSRMAVAYLDCGEYEQSINMAEKYWKSFQKQQKAENIFLTYVTNITGDCFQHCNRNAVICVAVRACVSVSRYEEAEEWLDRLDWKEQNLVLNPKMLEVIINAVPNADGEERQSLLRMCNRLVERQELEAYMVQCIELKSQSAGGANAAEVLIKYGEIEGKCAFFIMVRILRKIMLLEQGNAESVIKDIEEELLQLCQWEIDKVFATFIFYGFWNKAQEKGIVVGQIMQRIPFQSWMCAVKKYCEEEAVDRIEEFDKFLIGLLQEKDAHMLAWKSQYWLRKLVEAGKRLSKQEPDTSVMNEIMPLLQDFADATLELNEMFYKESVFEDYVDALPCEGQAAVWMLRWSVMLENGSYAEAVECLKNLKHIMPRLREVIKLCFQWVDMLIQEEQQEYNEFKVLSQTVKQKAKALIFQGEYSTARAILQQLQQMIPEDKEVSQMLQNIGNTN